jgi:thiamine pyrophosphate-dependent acetolactate synthase large subunit-like protein
MTPNKKKSDVHENQDITLKPVSVNVEVTVPTVEAIAKALPPTISIEDKEATAEYIVELLKQQQEAYEEADRKREKEHEEVVKAFDKERKEREKEHEEVVKALDEAREERDKAVKWGHVSFAINCLLALVSIYLGYLAYVVH